MKCWNFLADKSIYYYKTRRTWTSFFAMKLFKRNLYISSIKCLNSKVEIDSYKPIVTLELLPYDNSKKDAGSSYIINNITKELFNRDRMTNITKKHFFYESSFYIYKGLAGQYDYGPLGSFIIDNILREWDNFFVIQEDMMKLSSSTITPSTVLKASGHIERFTDVMTKDESTGEFYRLDHIVENYLKNLLKKEKSMNRKEHIKEVLVQIGGMSKEGLNQIVKTFDVKNPLTGECLSEAVDFNVMFPLSIGVSGKKETFLRPEMSQGAYMNFQKLFNWNRKKLPFSCAQVGTAYRNEINTGPTFLRSREFLMAEISHFCSPDDKTYLKFQQVCDTKVWLYSADDQLNKQSPRLITIKEAVEKKLISDETMGFYLAKIHQFLLCVGINPRKLRLRQHCINELAHYASQCWDAECLTSYGWIECVGCADRGSFDLIQHQKASETKFSVERPTGAVLKRTFLSPSIDKKVFRRIFKRKDYRQLISHELDLLSQEELIEMDQLITENGFFLTKTGFELTRELVPNLISEERECPETEEVLPVVIEPSFGINRIFYAILEHNFKERTIQTTRAYFSLPPSIAPIKVTVMTLSNRLEFDSLAADIVTKLKKLNLICRLDATGGAVGKAYVRWDEMGVPFAVTVDFDSINLTPPTVTLRERDSMVQTRIPVDKIANIVAALVNRTSNWEEVLEQYPVFLGQKTK